MRFFCLCIFIWGLGHVTHAQSPLIDLSFGSFGRVTVDIDSVDHCERVIADDNGNIYFFGYTERVNSGIPDRDYVIGKVDASGNIVNTFGSNGVIRNDFPGFDYSEITDAVVADDGILYCGNGGFYNNLDTQTVFVGKLHFDGKVDSTFGTNGLYSDTYFSDFNDIRSLHLLEDGRLLIAGVTFDSVIVHREIAFFGRLLPNGSRDSSFGTTGVQTWNSLSGLQSGMTIEQNRHIDGTVVNDINVSPWGTYFLTGYFDLGSTFSVFTASF